MCPPNGQFLQTRQTTTANLAMPGSMPGCHGFEHAELAHMELVGWALGEFQSHLIKKNLYT